MRSVASRRKVQHGSSRTEIREGNWVEPGGHEDAPDPLSTTRPEDEVFPVSSCGGRSRVTCRNRSDSGMLNRGIPCVLCVHALHAQHARCREDRLAPEEECTGRIASQDAGEFEDLHVSQPLLRGDLRCVPPGGPFVGARR